MTPLLSLKLQSLFHKFSLLLLELISLHLFTKTYLKTPDKLTLSLKMLVNNTQLNLGVLVELLLVFLEFPDLVLTELDKPLSVTCVEKVECLPLYKPTEDGIEKLMSTKEDTLLLLL